MYSGELKAAEQQCNRMIACAELRKTYERPEDIPAGDAELLYRRELAGKEEGLGHEHPSTLTAGGNLAQQLYHQAKWDEAEPVVGRPCCLEAARGGRERHP